VLNTVDLFQPIQKFECLQSIFLPQRDEVLIKRGKMGTDTFCPTLICYMTQKR